MSCVIPPPAGLSGHGRLSAATCCLVICAVVLFFAGIGTKLVNRRLRWGPQRRGNCIVLVLTLAWVATFYLSL